MTKKITQEQLGNLIGRKRPLISYIEQTGHVNSETLNKICKALHINKQELNLPAATVRKQDDALISQLKMSNHHLEKENKVLLEFNNHLKTKVTELEQKLRAKEKALKH